MHSCPWCYMACDCDGDDTWIDWPFNLDCTHCPDGEPVDDDKEHDYDDDYDDD